MKNRFLSLLLAALLLFSGTGCSALLGAEKFSVRDHVDDDYVVDTETDAVKAETYFGIKNAIVNFVKAGKETGVIKVSGYDGDIADAVSQACLEVTRETAIGQFAVDYMTHSYNRQLSSYEVRININYRCTPGQLAGILYLNYAVEVKDALIDALKSHKAELIIQITSGTVTSEYLQDYLKEYYRENPIDFAAMPEMSITTYSTASSQKILEIRTRYRFTLEQEMTMRSALRLQVDQILKSLKASTPKELAQGLCQALTDTTRYDDTGSGGTQSLAFGALVVKQADSIGFAMAYKLLCSDAGLSCRVVEGRLNGYTHWWNIVKIGNSCYHVDTSAVGLRGLDAVFLKTDADMWGSYWWDTDLYEPCIGPASSAPAKPQPSAGAIG